MNQLIFWDALLGVSANSWALEGSGRSWESNCTPASSLHSARAGTELR